MTRIDDITRRAIPTEYGGIQMKSRFEANVARLLDALNVAWLYEPKSFLLEASPTTAVHYQPDFYVPALHLWVEVRGYQSAKGEAQIDAFQSLIAGGGIDEDMRLRQVARVPSAQGDQSPPYAIETSPDFLVLSETPTFTEWYWRSWTGSSRRVFLAVCGQCSCVFFVGLGSFQCRVCGAHDQHHHLTSLDQIAVRGGNVFVGDAMAAEALLGELI